MRRFCCKKPNRQRAYAAGTPYQARKRLEGADLLRTLTAVLYTPARPAPTLTPDLLFWHWRAAFIAPLREQLSQYAPPLPLRYVYALDLYTYDTPVFYLLTDAPHAAVQAAFANFWIHGDNCRMKRLEDVGAAHIAQALTVRAQRYAQKQKRYTVRGGSLRMMFKLNTLHPLDRIRGHAQPDMLPTPRPGRVLHAAAACLGECCCPLVQKNCTTLWKYSSIPPCCASGCAFIGYAVPRRHGCALAITRQCNYMP